MTLLTIRIEGGLLSPDFLETIHDQPGQKPADFRLDARRSLVDEVTAVWSDVRTYWEAFERRRARAKDGESLTSATRETWIIPLLEALGYRLTFQRRAVEADGRSYAISHRATSPSPSQAEGRGEGESGPPIHIVAFDQKLGERPPAGRGTMSPHALVQDYLNRSDDLWGIVTNGATLRLLRDSVYFSRPSYVEFDLQGMLEGERLDEFILFYRLAHRTRLAPAGEDGSRCLLESYHQAAVEQGGRIRDGLRKAVEGAIGTLANGFLSHPKNGDLRRAISNSELSASGYYQQLLYLIYRLLFLMVAEERNLLMLADPAGNGGLGWVTPPQQGRGVYYLDHYSITRLRRLAEAPLSGPQRFDDLYLSLRSLFQVLRDETQAPALGVPALNGELFDQDRTGDLETAYLNNRDLLSAIRQLSYFTPEKEQVRRRVNYGALDVEELGSVYESLLDEYPVISSPAGGRPRFAFVQGSERKTTGSYYTARELVKETLDSALDPVIAERLKAAKSTDHASRIMPSVARQRALDALLSMRVCDSACGSGHFLLAAARRIGRALAQVATGEDEPSPEAVRRWTREAIIHCIYGVDKNPLAVDLCKVALWIEGFSEGKPLTFLDAHIKCGDSLVGVFDLKVLDDGIPDEAFDAVTGDDKTVARELKRRNKQERGGQLGLVFQAEQDALDQAARQWQAQFDSPEDTPAQVRQKRAAYRKLQQQEDAPRTACDLWTAAFFTPLTAANAAAGMIPTTASLQEYRRQPAAADPRLVAHARALAVRNQFFHWPLEFPHVFAAGGFTVMLGNPPWDMLQLNPQEFFAVRIPQIAAAPNTAVRDQLIAAVANDDPALYAEFQAAKHTVDAYQRFVHTCGRFPLTSYGRINLMALFSELVLKLLSEDGRAGIIVPTGIATDSFNQFFFADLVKQQAIVSLFDFENREAIFPSVHRAYKFSLLTVSRQPVKQSLFVFFATRVEHLADPQRRVALVPAEIALFNPNTHTMSVFRTGTDAELTKSIYQRIPVLYREGAEDNPWSISTMLMFMMNTDSKLFQRKPTPGFLSLYEGKMVMGYDHRAASVVTKTDNLRRPGQPVETLLQDHKAPTFTVQPQYWVPDTEVRNRVGDAWDQQWFISWKKVTSPTNERTLVPAVLPMAGVADSLYLLFPKPSQLKLVAGLIGNLNALVLDYIAKQKVGGVNLNLFYLQQFPVLPPRAYTASILASIAPRVLELVYTAWDMASFAADLWADADEALRAKLEEQHEAWLKATGGHPWNPPDWAGGDACPAPFAPAKWDDGRRARLRAELDAYYARLYGLTRDELRYILDPKEVYGPDFPGETFRVLKEKEERAYGEYRTRRLVLEAWDRLEAELGPVVVRNYREEMAATPGRVAETSITYQAIAQPARPFRG
ncbi:Eco57I restriction-modification methylase domain-containing protein [Candidatus Amarolinea aalborgensis]|uniref:Eco57I restriction-modification methylase domain-containing protein n=1 Tax=Candidatus Amarolinea aalborgensis TaxID=2249329 RepID=UPI003BF9A320